MGTRSVRAKSAILQGIPIFAIMACLVAPAIAIGQMTEPIDRVILLDANDKKIGDVLGIEIDQAGTHLLVLLKVGQHLVCLEARQDGFRGSSPSNAPEFLFESSDCSGTPYVPQPERDGLVRGRDVWVLPPGHTAYVADLEQGDRIINVMSQLLFGQCQPVNCFPDPCPATSGVVPLLALIDLDTQFSPPFRAITSSLPGSLCGDCNGSGTVTANEISRVILNVFNDAAETAMR